MRGSRKFLQMGSNFKNVFFPNTAKFGHHRPASRRHLNGVSLAERWWPNIECWLGSFVIFQGIRTSIAKKPFIFVIFQGGGGGLDPFVVPHPPSGSAHEHNRQLSKYVRQPIIIPELIP